MRLIDADALIEDVKTLWDYETVDGITSSTVLKQIVTDIQNAPTIPSPRWVRCEDELPKSVANKVLVFCDSEDRYPYVGFGHYEKYDGKETWYNLENGKPFTEWEYTVTHWMPLPEPPKDDV